MHAHADFEAPVRRRISSTSSRPLELSIQASIPCSPTSQPAVQQLSYRTGNILRAILSGAKLGRRTIRVPPRAVLERNHKKCGGQALFQFEIPIAEFPPEVLRQAQVDKAAALTPPPNS